MSRELSYAKAINEAQRQAMELCDDVIVLGQLADTPAGIFGTTSGLVDRFGPDRVQDFPVAENLMTATAMGSARSLVAEGPPPKVPLHLRSAAYRGAAEIGHGEGYRYSQEYAGGVVEQQYFPDGVEPEVLYRPKPSGEEVAIAERLAGIDRILGRRGRSQDDPA